MVQWWLMLAGALGAPQVARSDGASLGDDVDLVVLFGGEQRGEVGPCGCAATPLGGLDRIARYTESVQGATDAPVVLLNPGAWLSNQSVGTALLDTTVAANTAMHTALRHTPYDVLNVSFRDWPGVAAGPRPGLVSANLRASGVPVVRYRVLDAGPWRVAVTGVSRSGLVHLQPEGWQATDAIDAMVDLLPELRFHADLVVVLVYDLPRDTARIANLPGIDLVIEASDYRARYGPWVEGEAIWVRSWATAGHLGQLQIRIADGAIAEAVLQQIPLDDTWDPPRRRRPRSSGPTGR